MGYAWRAHGEWKLSDVNEAASAQIQNTRNIWKAWVLPIAAALIVTAIMMIERLQVDWSADCTLAGNGACDDDLFANLFAWLPAALTYAVFHIWGARELTVRTQPILSGLKRLVGIAVYVGIQLLPVPGWYLWYAGLAGGFLITLTVIGVVVAPFVGAMTAGFCAGVLLAAFAGPALNGLQGKQIKHLFWNYGLGGAFGALILSVGQFVFDPAFGHVAGPQNPWLTAFGALGTVLAVGVVMSSFGYSGWQRAKLLHNTRGLGFQHLWWVVALAALLVLPTHFMVKQSLTVFGRDGFPVPVIASALRGNKPAIDTPFVLGGLNYVGRREDVERREVIQRSRMEYTVLNKGTAKEVTESKTVYDGLEQWRLTDKTSSLGESVYITADQSSRMTEQECLPDITAGESFCVRPEPVERDDIKKTFAIAEDEDGFLLSEKARDASLGVRIAAQTPDVRDKKTWKMIYCRLNVVNVTSANFSAHQVIPCTADWVATAKAMRTRLEGDFRAVQPKP